LGVNFLSAMAKFDGSLFSCYAHLVLMKRCRFSLFVVGIVLAASLCGCDKLPHWLSWLPGGDPVLAQVGNEVVLRSDLVDLINKVPAAYQAQMASEQGRMGALQNLVRQKVFVQLARQSGVDRDPKFQEALENYKKTGPSPDKLKAFQDGLYMRFYYQSLQAQVPVSEKEIRDYDRKNHRELLKQRARMKGQPVTMSLHQEIKMRVQGQKIYALIHQAQSKIPIKINEAELKSLDLSQTY